MPLPPGHEAYCAWCGTYTELTYGTGGTPVLCSPCVDTWTAARTISNELWRDVTGWEGLYEVSHRGEVRSLDRMVQHSSRAGRPYYRLHRGQLITQHLNGSGYLFVMLSRQGKHKPCQVHTLVLKAFAGSCPPGQEGRHGPYGKLDNRWPENLCYGTHLQNMQDQIRDSTRALGSARGHARLTEDIVRTCRIRAAAGEVQASLAIEFGVSSQTMNKAISGITWSHVA